MMNEAKVPVRTPESSKVTAALVALLAGAVCIGLSPILVRLSEVGPTATAFYRVWLGLPVMGLWMLIQSPKAVSGESAPRPVREWMLLLLPGVFFCR